MSCVSSPPVVEAALLHGLRFELVDLGLRIVAIDVQAGLAC